jgi:glycine cleavage system H protein
MSAIFLILTFALFLVADIIVRKVQSRKAVAANAEPKMNNKPVPFGLEAEDLALPGGLFFYKGHTWAGIESSGKVKVGLDDFSQKIFGKIDGVNVKKVGDTISRGEKIFAVKQGERTAEFNSPVDGVINSINDEVVKNPNVLKDNPYEDGWVYSIKPTNLANDIKSLSVAEEALTWLKYEVMRFKRFVAEQFVNDKMLGKTLADGGIPVEGVMEQMDDFSWMKLQEEFLQK